MVNQLELVFKNIDIYIEDNNIKKNSYVDDLLKDRDI